MYRIGLLFAICCAVTQGESWCENMEQNEGWFRCEDRKPPSCIHPVLKCNNDPDCQDASDEINCSATPPPSVHRSANTYCPYCDQFWFNVVAYQNYLRSKEGAANMNEMQWSDAATEKAKAQAELCLVREWGENPHGNMDPDYGQNVARRYMAREWGDISWDDTESLIDLWYNEKQFYDYDTNNCTDDQVCGHYLTLVSSYVRDVGCAMVSCDRTSPEGDDVHFWNFVCNYRPWPNWQVWPTHPDQPFIKGETCTQCQPNLKCRNNVCA